MRDTTVTSDSQEISEQTFPDNGSISDLESELQTDQSVLGSPFEQSPGINKGLLALYPLFLLSFFNDFV